MPSRILLVEDDTATRVGLTTLLVESGYEVRAVSTLPDALSAVAESEPDLVLTDLRLDRYNGLQLAAAAPKQIPTIIVTAFPDKMLEAEAHRLGADYLLKPIVPADLLAAVARKLSEGQSGTGRHLPARRWARRPLHTRLSARIDHSPARILDVSYGGACLELHHPPGRSLDASTSLTVPDVSLSVRVAVIWRRRAGETSWLCGTAVADEHQPVWRGLVDAVS
jgi:CheY-like chemotaxis protein